MSHQIIGTVVLIIFCAILAGLFQVIVWDTIKDFPEIKQFRKKISVFIRRI